jgi:hypothetical protein
MLSGRFLRLALRRYPNNTAPRLLLEQRKDLGYDGIVVHHRPSTCASAASAWEGQKVIFMAR